jgi:hypothetical protein
MLAGSRSFARGKMRDSNKEVRLAERNARLARKA